MLHKIREQVNNYKTFYKRVEDNASIVRENLLKNKYSVFEESESIIKVKEENTCRCVGIDSGFFNETLTGMDFVYVKTAGSYFNYQNGKIKKYKKILNRPKKELYFAKNILQKDEVHKFVSIARIREELELARLSITDTNPDFLLIDGPVLPQPVDRPSNNSKLYPDYKLMVEEFVKLYDLAKSNNVVIVGCVEDSRATSFLDLIENKHDRINDTLFLNLVLQKKEGLSFFKTFATESNIINQDLKEFGNYEFFASYMKLNEDYPLRVESPTKQFNKIRNTIGFLAGQLRDYCFPTPLIDADKQAKLNNSEVETIKCIIEKEFMKIGIKKLRRERRI